MDARSAATDVRFVVVPFLPAQQPAIGISYLMSVLRGHGFSSDAAYLNLDYGRRVGWTFYDELITQVHTAFLPGEMVFTRALWGEQARSFDAYERQILGWFEALLASRPKDEKRQGKGLLVKWWEDNRDKIEAAVHEAPAVISRWADEILAAPPRVLGFTSTFQQNVASLALAREIRRRVPREEVAIVFGGANCEADMGQAMAECFDFIDCVVSGEGEQVVVDVVRGLIEGPTPARFVQGPMVRDMDALPLPDFSDYFASLVDSGFEKPPYLAIESSRGCWWGVKSHCTFCGLNGGNMTFRSKSAARFAAELEELSTEYDSTRFAVTDNILDMRYLRSLIPDLIRRAQRFNAVLSFG